MKALSLMSGGLDSTLATKVMLEQGIEVVAVNFVSPFCRCSHRAGCQNEARFISQELGIPLKVVNVTEDYLSMLKSPKHGYGSHMNPCMDCRILMLKKAREMMEKEGASFLVTGEVLGQRPMSQRRDAMRTIEKEAGVDGILVRPLSAKLLPPTLPEQKGWVDRQRLLDISGRSRKTQIAMAADFNIKDYPCPAGGCLLTDPAYSKRIKDLIDHDELTLAGIRLLNHGRYFRLSPSAKLVVGKDQHDNEVLETLKEPGDIFFMPREDIAGASGLGRGDFSSPALVELAARIVARYSDQKAGAVPIVVERAGGTTTLSVAPIEDDEGRKHLV